MGGIDGQAGLHYQNCIGVMRLLELISDDRLIDLEFESDDESLTDITRFYVDGHAVLEQVKKKDDGSWTPHRMKEVMKHFLDKWMILRNKYELEFVFTTYESASAKMKRIEMIKDSLSATGSRDDTKRAMRELEGLFPKGTDKSDIIEVARRTKFNWNEAAPRSIYDPVANAVSSCCSTLASRCGLSSDDASVRFNELYQAVVQFSTTKRRLRRCSRRDLQSLLPHCIDIEAKLSRIGLPDNILRWLLKKNITYVETDVVLDDRGECYMPKALIKSGEQEYVVWVLRECSTQEDLSRVSRIVEAAVRFRHLVVILDENISDYDVGLSARKCIVRPDTLDDSILQTR